MICLEDNLKGRSLTSKVIPTVCNLKNMLKRLKENSWDESKLKQWEKRSFKAYQIGTIKQTLMFKQEYEWPVIIRKHILQIPISELGASAIDIYLVAYLVETFDVDKSMAFHKMTQMGISDKTGSCSAIWQVGKGDGVYLGILNENGSVRDWKFMEAWVQ